MSRTKKELLLSCIEHFKDLEDLYHVDSRESTILLIQEIERTLKREENEIKEADWNRMNDLYRTAALEYDGSEGVQGFQSPIEPRKISTLEGVENFITTKRCDGNTTRLVDRAIQIIFSGNICVVKDHWMNGEHDESNRFLYDRIMDRLENEYICKFDGHSWILADMGRMEIRFVRI
jgi:hypothetical protein